MPRFMYFMDLLYWINAKANVDFARIGPLCDELADFAGQYGIKFSWENVSWCWYSYPEFADRLMENTRGAISILPWT